jgi:HTH-type transcriptional regulator, glycine betaine synthesis regulator
MATTEPSPSDRRVQVEEDFIDLWGSMSSLWGVNPTMARLHGLLFITAEAMSMDMLMTRLAVSRGNVSMNLTKLAEWGLVRRVHKKGDRRDYYESVHDVWELVTLVAAQRKRREIDPLLSALRRLRDRLPPAPADGPCGDALAPDRLNRINGLLALLGVLEDLSQRLFESPQSLRSASELLARPG